MPSLLDFRRARMFSGGKPPMNPYGNIQLNGTPPQQPIINRSAPPPTDNGDDNLFTSLQGMYNAPSPALDAYKQHVSAMPQRENFQPTKMGRVMAALVGAGEGLDRGAGAGFNASSSMIQQPYQTALSDYKMKGSGLGELADIESKDMKGKMDYASDLIKNRNATLKTGADVKNIESQIKDRESKAPLTQAQIDNLNSQTNNRGVRYERNQTDGQLYKIDANGKSTPIMKVTDTLAEADTRKKNMFGYEEGVKFGNAKSMEGIKLGNAKSKRKFDAANPIPSSTGFDSTPPSQTSIAQQSAVREVLLRNPGWAKFTTFDDPDKLGKAYAADPRGHSQFVAQVKAAQEKIIKAGNKTPVRPTVNIPNSPLHAADDGTDAALRQKAIETLQSSGEALEEENIQYVMDELRNQ